MAKNRLRDLRKEKRLTIAQAADIFHLQPTQYRRYEMNESDLPMEIGISMAKYFGVMRAFLMIVIAISVLFGQGILAVDFFHDRNHLLDLRRLDDQFSTGGCMGNSWRIRTITGKNVCKTNI